MSERQWKQKMQNFTKQIQTLYELLSEIQKRLSYQEKEGFIKTIQELETINSNIKGAVECRQ